MWVVEDVAWSMIKDLKKAIPQTHPQFYQSGQPGSLCYSSVPKGGSTELRVLALEQAPEVLVMRRREREGHLCLSIPGLNDVHLIAGKTPPDT
jgi:hypothetical protein